MRAVKVLVVALAMLVGIGGFALPGSAAEQAESAGTGYSWSALVVPGAEESYSPPFRGYSRWGRFGSLTAAERLVLSGRRVRLLGLFEYGGGLYFLAAQHGMKHEFVLQVGDQEFAASDSYVPVANASGAYWWPIEEPLWTHGEPIDVSLTYGSAPAALGDRPPAPPTARFGRFPGSHDGSAPITAELDLGGELDIDAAALKASMIVEGGTLDKLKQVSRSSTRRWKIKVTPGGDAAEVAVWLDNSVDCGSAGALCTADGRSLFNAAQLTVPDANSAPPSGTVNARSRLNSEPTGRPAISGTKGYATRLRATVGHIADADGLSSAVFAYQWTGIRGSAATVIAGATESEYTADAADGFDSYRVRVRYVDDGGQTEFISSEPADFRKHVVRYARRMPDLVSTAPDRFLLRYERPGKVPLLPADGTGQIRRNTKPMLLMGFRSSIRNVGNGPLDISGNPQLDDQADATSHDAWQRTRDDDNEWVKLTKPPIRFETADNHDHFHLMRAAEYSLWDKTGRTRLQTAPKVGFCLIDTEPSFGYGGTPQYIDNCAQYNPSATDLRMGISPGWMDSYPAEFTFQWVDISDVQPGRYRLAGEVDPDDLIWESDETNNGIAMSGPYFFVPGYRATAQQVTTVQDTPLPITLATDEFGLPGPVKFRIVEGPSNGTLDVDIDDALSTATVTYTPDAGFVGSDSFEFEAFDGDSKFPRDPAGASVTIEVDAAPASTRTPTPTRTAEPKLTPTPFGASFEQVPESHDGSTAFSFHLMLSENIIISYVTVRDAVLNVSGGDVVRARRLTRGSNRGWQIVVRPSGDADVEIVLPGGGPCTRAGILCTGDGRKLARQVEATIPGPG